MDLNKIKKINWHYLINRRESLLFCSLADNSYRFFKSITGIPWRTTYILRFDEGDYFINYNDLKKLKSIFSNEGIKKFYIFRSSLIYNINKLQEIMYDADKKDYSKLSKMDLSKELNKYIKFFLYACSFLNPVPMLDRVISEKIVGYFIGVSEEQKQKLLRILIYPLKDNEHIKEEKSFYKLCELYKNKDKRFNKYLANHLKCFSWIGGRYLWENNWTEKDIKNRINIFFQQKRDPKKELLHLNEIKNSRKNEENKLFKKLKVKNLAKFKKYIAIAKDFAFLRTWRTDVIYRVFYESRVIFLEVAKRAGLKDINDIRFLTFSEVIKTAKYEKLAISAEELKTRKKNYVMLSDNKGCKILSGRDWKKKLQIIINKNLPRGKEVKGNVAFSGRVKGLVKIVKIDDDLNKIKRGDIMVAVMTFPHFISAMEKASAFITDEGGILCHAAIVAREMKKPCIIGTKFATKVLKDGDLVEVDADKGIVKILKRK